MKRITILTLSMLLCASAVSCATLQQPAAEPDTAVAQETRAVDAYVLIPRKSEDQEATAATITGDDETIRWVPLKITVNVPVPQDERLTE